MRTHGTLTKWNDDRGFGFISPARGDEELFVHISAFPNDGKRPRINELISYEVETGPDGKLRAVRVMRPRAKVQPGVSGRKQQANEKRSSRGILVAMLVVAVVGAYSYGRFTAPPDTHATQSNYPSAGAAGRFDTSPPPIPAAPAQTSLSSESGFECDGRTMCSEMNSCAEARYFLSNCSDTRMDGDYDGVPCEQQWCN